VPKILLSGDHKKVARWRRGQALYRTSLFRPDLFSSLILSDDDRQLIEEARKEEIFFIKGE
jgi:tRNA (guanine37-N1)-methyltransferase